MFFQSVEPRLERGERVANLVGDPGGQGAERGEFLLPFKHGLTLDQLEAQRRNGVAVNHPAQCRDQQQQHHDTGNEHVLQAGERSGGVGQKARFRHAVSGGQAAHEIAHSLGLGVEIVELRQLPRARQGG